MDGDDLGVVRCRAVDHLGRVSPAAEPGEASSHRRVQLCQLHDRRDPTAPLEIEALLVVGRHGEQGDGEDAPADHLVHTEDVDVGDGDAGCLVRGQVVTFEVEGDVVDPPLAIGDTGRGGCRELLDERGIEVVESVAVRQGRRHCVRSHQILPRRADALLLVQDLQHREHQPLPQPLGLDAAEVGGEDLIGAVPIDRCRPAQGILLDGENRAPSGDRERCVGIVEALRLRFDEVAGADGQAECAAQVRSDIRHCGRR